MLTHGQKKNIIQQVFDTWVHCYFAKKCIVVVSSQLQTLSGYGIEKYIYSSKNQFIVADLQEIQNV